MDDEINLDEKELRLITKTMSPPCANINNLFDMINMARSANFVGSEKFFAEFLEYFQTVYPEEYEIVVTARKQLGLPV